MLLAVRLASSRVSALAIAASRGYPPVDADRLAADGPRRLSLPGLFRRVSILNATATHCMHSNCTPGGVPAGSSTNALTIDHVHTGTACFADLRDHAVRLMKRRGRHGLRGCYGEGKSKSDEPNHWFLHVIPSWRGDAQPLHAVGRQSAFVLRSRREGKPALTDHIFGRRGDYR